jgi:hypothetical protein
LDFILSESEALLEEYRWQSAEKREPLERLVSTVKNLKQYRVNTAQERTRLDEVLLGLALQTGEYGGPDAAVTYEVEAQALDQLAFSTRDIYHRVTAQLGLVDADLALAITEKGKPETKESVAQQKRLVIVLQVWEQRFRDNILGLHDMLRSELLPQQRVQVVEEARRNLMLLNRVLKVLLPRLKHIGIEDGSMFSEMEKAVRSLHRLKYSSEAIEFMLFPTKQTSEDVARVITAIDAFQARGGDLSLLPMEQLDALTKPNSAASVGSGLRGITLPSGIRFPQNSGVHRKFGAFYEDILGVGEDFAQAHRALDSLELWVEGIMHEQTTAAETALSKELPELQRFMGARQAFRMENLRIVLRDRLSAMRTRPELRSQVATLKRIDRLVSSLGVSPGANNTWRIFAPSGSLKGFRAREEWLATQEIDFSQMAVEQIDYLAVDFSNGNR